MRKAKHVSCHRSIIIWTIVDQRAKLSPWNSCPTDFAALNSIARGWIPPLADIRDFEAARREMGRRICAVRVQRASDGKPLEGPLADWPGGVL
jgi:hypothetical protein